MKGKRIRKLLFSSNCVCVLRLPENKPEEEEAEEEEEEEAEKKSENETTRSRITKQEFNFLIPCDGFDRICGDRKHAQRHRKWLDAAESARGRRYTMVWSVYVAVVERISHQTVLCRC